MPGPLSPPALYALAALRDELAIALFVVLGNSDDLTLSLLHEHHLDWLGNKDLEGEISTRPDELPAPHGSHYFVSLEGDFQAVTNCIQAAIVTWVDSSRVIEHRDDLGALDTPLVHALKRVHPEKPAVSRLLQYVLRSLAVLQYAVGGPLGLRRI
jgi:hypothetical protein